MRFNGAPPDTRTMQNQPTSTADSLLEEAMAETDEPPDEQHISFAKQSVEKPSDFKKMPCGLMRKQSLLTQTLHSSESDSQHDDVDAVFSGSNRAHSSASTWSRGSVASLADLISDGQDSPTRTGTPSPPLPPARFHGLPPAFNQESFKAPPPMVKIATEPVDPLRKTTPASVNEDAVEKALGRKRCLMFACGGKTEPKKEEVPMVEAKAEIEKPEEPVKRQCALKFVCPTRANTSPTVNKPHVRLASPAPRVRRFPGSPKPQSPKATRSHRGSDSTVRNDSPKSVRKVPSALRPRRSSTASEVPVFEATRFHEFASSEEERDDWTQEASCYRSRLTVQDTLKVESGLRQLGEEAEDEEMEDEEAEEQLAGLEDEDLDDDDDDEEDDDNGSLIDSTGYVTDEGFHTDDEEGFANSDDDDSDTGSDYRWWAPGTGSGEHLEHIRPAAPRRDSGSSIGSFSSTRVFPSKTPKALKRSKTNPIEFRPRTPELPDSTDFVCGTLDEDRPLEEAWLSCREQRRAAKHKPCPQDIDPTFPASDPEMDEEEEEGYEDAVHIDDSDHHFLIHGHPEAMSDLDEREPRSIVPKKRSPAHSPKRLRSPPPVKKAVHHSPPPRKLYGRSPPPAKKAVLHHSPPPRKLFGHSPKRMTSPAPRRPLRSPPPSRRTSFIKDYEYDATPIALGQRPNFGHSREASSLPRNGAFALHRGRYFNATDNDSDGDETQTDALLTRGAIDIVKGLEKKRQRRKEKLFEKHCRMRSRGKNVKQHVILPGVGAEKMRQMGEKMCAIKGHGAGRRTTEAEFRTEREGQGAHILSY